jgi:hypothetical protein
LAPKILEPGVAAEWFFAREVPEEERARIRERLFGHVPPVEGRQETDGVLRRISTGSKATGRANEYRYVEPEPDGGDART